ncbi:MAG: acylphosphatase [Nanoarchaeota archaeon]|mgnify:CR=1 FL=1
MKCIHLKVSGMVQGVNFRNNTRRKALELGLVGFAKNLLDGTVEVVAQGNEEKMKEFVDFIKKGPGFAKITEIEIQHKQPENFKNFEIMR